MTPPRYAIYFAPEPGTPLDLFGRQWLGRDHAGRTDDQLRVAVVTPRRLAGLTEGPRHYGLHCTLKPPFRLNETSSAEGLLTAAHLLAKGLAPVEIPPLELDVIGKFIALTPTASSAAVEMLAASCVRAFEGFRQPLTQAQVAEYHRNRLTVHQEQMLEHWGYPYVMEEFQFHITLTDPIPDERERNVIMEALRELAAPILGRPIPLRELTVFREPDSTQPMSIIARLPFGRKA
jgi:putative phosphonate metabolism protein